MKLIEVSQPTPDVIRLFLEPRLQAGNFLMALVESLGREHATNFHNVNRYLESSLGDANRILEDMGTFQGALEKTKGSDKELEAEYEDLRARSQSCLVELHRAKIKINDLKISLCRFIIIYESATRTPPRPFRTVEEWMDAATLAEMRFARALQPNGDRNLQRLLALFMTFRSIVCSYDGPSMYIRQIENFLASLDAIYEKVQLEMEVVKATRRLVETRKELSTVKINLTSLENQLLEKKNQAEQLSKLMSLQDRSPFPAIASIGLLLTVLAFGAGYWLFGGRSWQSQRPGAVISQHACLDIEKQLAKSPNYQSQVLIFRKFGDEVYFRANAMTCEKLHRLDSVQITSLAELLRVDYSAGNQGTATYGDHRVLQVKDKGINKLVIKLSNHTEKDLGYKVKVLERAVAMRALLQAEKAPDDDLLIVDLSMKQIEL